MLGNENIGVRFGVEVMQPIEIVSWIIKNFICLKNGIIMPNITLTTSLFNWWVLSIYKKKYIQTHQISAGIALTAQCSQNGSYSECCAVLNGFKYQSTNESTDWQLLGNFKLIKLILLFFKFKQIKIKIIFKILQHCINFPRLFHKLRIWA